jgi:hypothetical protein
VLMKNWSLHRNFFTTIFADTLFFSLQKEGMGMTSFGALNGYCRYLAGMLSYLPPAGCQPLDWHAVSTAFSEGLRWDFLDQRARSDSRTICRNGLVRGPTCHYQKAMY